MRTLFWLLTAATQLLMADDAGDQLLAAARKGDAGEVKRLLDQGVNVNSKNRYGSTPLFFACDRGHLEVAKLLIDRGADLNARDTFYNASALTWAFSNNRNTLVELLIDRGADVSELLWGSVQQGNTKLFETITGRATLSKRLLDEALYAAVLYKREEMAKRLESFGATPLNINVDSAAAAQYTGKYTDGDMVAECKHEDGKLIVIQQNGPRFTLLPLGRSQFRTIQGGITLTFDRDPKGAVSAVRFNPRGGEVTLKKVQNGE